MCAAQRNLHAQETAVGRGVDDATNLACWAGHRLGQQGQECRRHKIDGGSIHQEGCGGLGQPFADEGKLEGSNWSTYPAARDRLTGQTWSFRISLVHPRDLPRAWWSIHRHC